jgi:hypothetical protein
MSLSVSVSTVKRKCRITVSDFDTEIQDTINEQLPAIEFSLDETFVADVGNAGLQATLNLGAAEVISGEFLAQLFRDPGSSEEIDFFDIRFGRRNEQFADAKIIDPFGLKAQGWLRLSPFLKAQAPMMAETGSAIAAKVPLISDVEFES